MTVRLGAWQQIICFILGLGLVVATGQDVFCKSGPYATPGEAGPQIRNYVVIWDILEKKSFFIDGTPVDTKLDDRLKVGSIDSTPPNQAEVSIAGRAVLPGDLIPVAPAISALISDFESGVATWSMEILDAANQVVRSASGNAGMLTESVSVTLSIGLRLDPGQYSIKSTVFNGMGASTETIIAPVYVASEFGLSGVISAPNPFNPNRETAHIQYQLGQASDVELVLFSLSGERLLTRRFAAGDSGAQVGLNEFEWDGRNDFGETVSNGPYVAYLTVRSNGKTKSGRVKMMVLK